MLIAFQCFVLTAVSFSSFLQFFSVRYDRKFFYKHFSALADFGLYSISASVFSVTPILGDVW